MASHCEDLTYTFCFILTNFGKLTANINILKTLNRYLKANYKSPLLLFQFPRKYY